ncbi:MAG: DUF3021 domain-containing protein [Enterococcus sp.]
MIKKLVQYFSIGVLIGSFIYLAFFWISPDISMNRNAITINFFVSGIIGMTTLIFDRDERPFLVILGIHYLMVLVLISIAGYFAKWMPTYQTGYFIYYLQITGIYILVWAGIVCKNKLNAKSMNAELKLKKENKKN